MSIYLQASLILAVILVIAAALIGYILFAATRKTTAGALAVAAPGILVILGFFYAMIVGMLMGY